MQIQQHVIRGFSNLADRFKASCRQRLLNTNWKLNPIYRRIVRQFRRWIGQTAFLDVYFAFHGLPRMSAFGSFVGCNGPSVAASCGRYLRHRMHLHWTYFSIEPILLLS